MNKHIYFLFLLLTSGVCRSQNLVINPSFEDTLACPTGFSTTNVDFIAYAQGWSTSWNSADYYNGCSSGPNSVPNNIAGHYPAATGQAYCGMFVAWDNGATDYHENIVSQLSTPLNVGTKYYISFKTVCAGQSGSIWQKACNKMGILFSNSTWVGLINFSHLYSDTIIADTLNWTTVSGSFIADSAYNYILVGSFFDRFNISISNLNTSVGPGAYYFFDDICVSVDSLDCNTIVGMNHAINDDELVVFPNPYNEQLNITLRNNETVEINLYDIAGRKMFTQKFVNSISINTKQFEKGLYIYEIIKNNSVYKKGKVVKE